MASHAGLWFCKALGVFKANNGKSLSGGLGEQREVDDATLEHQADIIKPGSQYWETYIM